MQILQTSTQYLIWHHRWSSQLLICQKFAHWWLVEVEMKSLSYVHMTGRWQNIQHIVDIYIYNWPLPFFCSTFTSLSHRHTTTDLIQTQHNADTCNYAPEEGHHLILHKMSYIVLAEKLSSNCRSALKGALLKYIFCFILGVFNAQIMIYIPTESYNFHPHILYSVP